MVCFECGADAQHQHHVVPRSQGGTKTVPLCLSCHSLAHFSRMARSELTRAAMERRKAQGMRVGSVPHGWRETGGKLVPDDRELDAKRRAVQLRADGLSLRAVSTELHALGFVNRLGRPFNPKSVRSMLADNSPPITGTGL